MFPSLFVGDHIFVKKSAYGWVGHGVPERGDIIVFRFPERRDQDFVKRAIGLPGDRIQIRAGNVFINGWQVPSCPAGRVSLPGEGGKHEGSVVVEFLGSATYIVVHDEAYSGGGPLGTYDEQGPYVVAPGQAFTMGDNRENSHDSRLWFEGKGGGVPIEDIKGRASIVWMSFAPHEIAWSRVGIRLTGSPYCGEPFSPQVCAAVARCVAERPPISATTPPAGGGAKR
jgi:signal peptidase I